MTPTIKFAATLSALALAIALSGQALANTKGPSGPSRPSGGGAAGQNHHSPHGYGGYHHGRPYIPAWKTGQLPTAKRCYWLPTMSNGSVTGLEKICN